MSAVAGVSICLATYLLGGVPIGLLVARRRGLDIRRVGSGNIGASNVLRSLGARSGLIVWVADVLKGFLPVTLTAAFYPLAGEGAAWWLGAIGLSAVVGHCFSPYLGLKGGRGVSTILGVVFAFDWKVALIGLALWIVVVAVTRYISLGSITAVLAAGPLLTLLGAPSGYWTSVLCAGALVTARHAANIGRLLAGTESRIGQRVRLEPAADE